MLQVKQIQPKVPVLFDEEGYRHMQPVLKDLARKGFEYKEYDGNELGEKLGIQTNLTDDKEAQLMGLANVHKGIFIPKAGLIDVDSLVKFYESEFEAGWKNSVRYRSEKYSCGGM